MEIILLEIDWRCETMAYLFFFLLGVICAVICYSCLVVGKRADGDIIEESDEKDQQ